MTTRCVTPRMKPLSARKSAILCALDIGTSKIVCLIARLVRERKVCRLPARKRDRHRILELSAEQSRERRARSGRRAGASGPAAAQRSVVGRKILSVGHAPRDLGGGSWPTA